MPLKLLVKTLEEIPEAFRGEYKKQDDGSYMLDTDNSDYQTKIDEFRKNNISLSNKKDLLEKSMEKFKDVDIEEYEKAKKALQVLNQNAEGKLIAEGKIDEALAMRTDAMRKDYDNKIDALTKARDAAVDKSNTFGSQLSRLKLESLAFDAFDGIGRIRSGARTDVLNRAASVWKLNDAGDPVPVNSDGTTMFGKDGSTPLQPKEWAANLVKEASYLFEESGGGGAAGGNRRGGSEPTGGTINNDPTSIGKNLAAVAAGKIKVNA